MSSIDDLPCPQCRLCGLYVPPTNIEAYAPGPITTIVYSCDCRSEPLMMQLRWSDALRQWLEAYEEPEEPSLAPAQEAEISAWAWELEQLTSVEEMLDWFRLYPLPSGS